MNNNEVIIEKIIKDAQIVADENISKAQKEVDSIEADTKQKISEYRSKMLPKGEAQAKDIERRKEMVNNLDCKKILLAKKTEIVDSVFSSVAEVMRSKDKKGYISLIEKMICNNASDGDIVVICKKDKDILTKEVIDGIAKKIDIKIVLSKEFGDFDGGVILCGVKFDKNLTFDLEFELLKEESESELAKILFGE